MSILSNVFEMLGDTKKTFTLKETITYLSNIKNINKGGCPFASIVIHDQLKKMGVKSEIYYLYRLRNRELFNENIKAIKNNSRLTSCTHSVVRVGYKYVDSNGYFDISEYPLKTKMTKMSVISSLKGACWNNMFNRTTQLPKIENKFDIIFFE